MTLRLVGSLDEVAERLADALHPVGWTFDRAPAGPWPVRPGAGAAVERCGWLVIEPAEADCLVCLWLPEEGPSASREALENAVAGLLEPTSDDPALMRRLRRIEGQIRGLQRMLETNRDCEAVLTQFAAVSAALKQTAAQLVSEHLVECIRGQLATGGDVAEINRRLLNVLF